MPRIVHSRPRLVYGQDVLPVKAGTSGTVPHGMAFLLAAQGHVGRSDWDNLAREVADLPGCDFREWHDEEAGVRLGIRVSAGTVPALNLSSAGLVAIGTGILTSGKDVAAGVIEAYSRLGYAGLAQLRGQYSFALWDGAARSLWAGTDAVGLSAPAYVWEGGRFLLSSRALALLRTRKGPAPWDSYYLAHAFGGLWSRTASATAFQGITRMLGGEILRASSGGLERLAGDRLSFRASRPMKQEEAVDELSARLDRVVGPTASDRETCVAVSGGIDSCAVAASVARKNPQLAAFSLVAPGRSRSENEAVASVVASFPAMRHHRVEIPSGVPEPVTSSVLFDDPICAGPVLQPGRLALYRAVREAGFRRILDGEGGDELFDMAWWPRDPVRELAWGHVVRVVVFRASRARVVRDVAASGVLGPLSRNWERRARERLCRDRPWLREAFWESSSFAEASVEARAYRTLQSASERLPEILGAHGQYWRAQSLARVVIGVEGVSPLLDRTIVELVGSLRASVAMHPRHRKALLRRLAARRVPPSVAWRPKAEPLSDWLVQQYLSSDANVWRAVSLARRSEKLQELMDAEAFMPALEEARRGHRPALASSLVEALLLVEWVTAVEQRYGCY